MHSGTFNNHVISTAAGVAALKIYDEAAVEKLNGRGNLLYSKVQDIFVEQGFGSGAIVECSKLPRMWISGRGSIFSIRFSGEGADALKGLFWHHMLEHFGIYLSQRGFMALTLEVTEDDIELFARGVRSFVSHYNDLLIDEQIRRE